MDDRINAIEALPPHMKDHALVPWATTATLMNVCVPIARKILKDGGIPLVQVSERKKLPRWGALRTFLEAREKHAA